MVIGIGTESTLQEEVVAVGEGFLRTDGEMPFTDGCACYRFHGIQIVADFVGRFSCFFSVVGALLQTFVTITFAYCCTMYKFPGSNLPYTIILVIMVLPIYGAGGATYALYRQLGMVDSYTHIICSAAGMTGSFLYFRAFFKNMSWTYAEAAAMDGCGPFRLYFKVMLPQAKPIFGALFLTTWLASWNNYESALLYLPNLPTLPVGIYQFNTEMIYRARLDILFAACVLVSIPALVLFTVFNKMITTNVSVGGIKG